MVLGLIKPDSGEILINGESNKGSNRNFLSSIGALIEKPDFTKIYLLMITLRFYSKCLDLKTLTK